MPKCAAVTAKGERCKGLVRPGNDYCPAHDPARAEARRKAASKAGRSKTGTDLHKLKERLIEIGEDVYAGRVNRGDAAVAVTAFGTAAKVIESWVKLRELEEARLVETRLKEWEVKELVPRLEALEAQQEAQRQSERGNRWGA